ncbi:class I lanthipeptide [Archangium primigenium]|uniref:class I lanthipeptide n=1 Tax=[Archangium] primigenium TaxID=2792470 RepID=UPI00195EFC0B|nr:class I lanthipeptide [Archangium primigenium]
MKTDKKQGKLSLHKETLRHLSEESLERVVGGNGDSGGIICLYSLILCGDSVICSILAGSCNNDNGG